MTKFGIAVNYFSALIFFVLYFFVVQTTDGAYAMNLSKLLPEEIDRWSPQRPDETYDRDTIFDYMNGAGEIYVAYGFQKLLVREYGMAEEPRIVAELYDMTTSEDAFGIYSHDTDGKPIELGQNAVYAGGLLRFWKDRYFLRLLAERETAETKAVLMEMGAYIAKAIQKSGSLPRIIELLPKKGLLADQVKYFHNHISLAVHYYLADTNILNLDLQTEVVLGTYVKKDHKIRLLLVGYPDNEAALAAYAHFNRIYFADKPKSSGNFRLEKIERNEYTGVRVKERFLVIVFESVDEQTCAGLINSTLGRLEESYDGKNKRPIR